MNEELIKQIQSSIEHCETIIRLEQMSIDGLKIKLEELKKEFPQSDYFQQENGY